MNDMQMASSADASSLLEALLSMPIPSPTAQYVHTDSHMSVDEAQALLQTLLAAMPSGQIVGSSEVWRPDTQGDAVLQDWQRRDRFDTVLVGAQRGLLVVSVMALGTWAAIGPIGNWVYKQYAQPMTQTIPRQATVGLPASVEQIEATSRSAHPLEQRAVDASNDHTAIASQPDGLAPSQMADVAHANTQLDNKAVPQPDALVPSRMKAVAPANLPPQPTHLMLPSIGVDTPVVEVFTINDEWDVAKYAAGYLNGTGLPGEANNMVLAGHAGFFGGVFANLHKLGSNDDVYVDAAGWRYQYRVRKSTVVWPTETEVLFHTDIPTLTLITCTNWDLQSLVVVADFVGARPL